MSNYDLQIFHRSKIDSWSTLIGKLAKALQHDDECYSLHVPTSLHLSSILPVPYTLRTSLRLTSATGICYVAHCGAGPENHVLVWTKEDGDQKLRNFKKKLDCRIKHFVFIPTSFLIFAACDDLTLRVFSGSFYEHCRINRQISVLSMLFDEATNSVLIGIVGYVQQWKLSSCLTMPPTLSKEVHLEDKFSGNAPWIKFLHMASQINRIIALAGTTMFFLDSASLEHVQSLENRHDFPLTACTTYAPRQYLITGSQDGVIKVWSMTIASYPHVVSFTGHTKRIISLQIHPTEPILFSVAAEPSIRMWRLETFKMTLNCIESKALSLAAKYAPNLQVVKTNRIETSLQDCCTKSSTLIRDTKDVLPIKES